MYSVGSCRDMSMYLNVIKLHICTVAMIIFMTCVFHHNDKHGNENKSIKRRFNSGGDWLVGNTELASEREGTAFPTPDTGSLGGSQVTRVFVVRTELAGKPPAKLLRTAAHEEFSHLGRLSIT